MGDSLSEDMLFDLDLNLVPSDPPATSGVGLGPVLSDLETAHGMIEDRIRQLEAVTARARQRQRWREARNNPELNYISIEPSLDSGEGIGLFNGEGSMNTLERASDRGCKRDSSHLVAKALAMDLDVKTNDGDVDGGCGGSFYDCNICLDTATEPVLTCCGHLFCWPCFYKLPLIDSIAKECPVCKGEVTDAGVTPIYGNGNGCKSSLHCRLSVPPRPKARRVESVRQQRASHGISHIPVAEVLRRIRTGIGSTGEQPPRLASSDSAGSSSQNTEAGVIHRPRPRPRQFSRVLSESAASLSSISSALNNAERLVENLETYIHDRRSQITPLFQLRSIETFLMPAEPRPSIFNASISSSPRGVDATHLPLDNLGTDATWETDPAAQQQSSGSRLRLDSSGDAEENSLIQRDRDQRRRSRR